MAKPPASPSSSDIVGVDRDEPKLIAEREESDPDQLVLASEETAARPDYDPDIASKGNSQ